MKDYYESDSGLEYIGERGQQIGDGGFIAQFKNARTDELITASSNEWKCQAIHQALLNKQCEHSNNRVLIVKRLLVKNQLVGWAKILMTVAGRQRLNMPHVLFNRNVTTVKLDGTTVLN